MRGIQYLHPDVRDKAMQLQAIADLFGEKLLITATWRTEAEQNDCHKKGTSKAQYPNSAHCWGVAFDFCKNVKGQEYSDLAFFRRIGGLAQLLGLYWGGNFKTPDNPHIEDRTFVPSGSTATLKAKYGTPEKFKATWPGAAPTARPVLRKGDKGQDVKDLQNLLNIALASAAALTVDGSFGPAVEAALKTYQKSKGLSVDGVCGPKTWAALEGV